MNLSKIVARGWEIFVAGEFDELIKDYTESMKLIFPGQANVMEGRQPFRKALDGISDMLPAGFEITGLRHMEGVDEVVSIVDWRSEKVSSSQLTVLFEFEGEKISEERWFIDTEQWANTL